jgi:hypothetical protein
VTGPLDVPALRAGWFSVLDRQQVLRTRLVEAEGDLWQQVGPAREDSFQLQDATGATESYADELAAAVAGASLDLATGPLAKLVLIRTASDQHRLMVVAHQVVADESSLSLLFDELSGCYSIQVGVRPDSTSLPRLPCQYVDYARWQRGQHLTERYQQARDWWASALAAAPPLAPVVPGAKPPLPAPVGGQCRSGPVTPLPFGWGTALGRQLTALAQAEGTTRLAILLAAFQVLLGRRQGAEQVIVGVPVAVRPRPEFGVLIGPFTNLLALPGDLSGEPTFRQLLRRLDRCTRSSLDHREVPFPDVVRALRPQRDPHRLPLCQATLAIHEPVVEPRLVGTVIRSALSPLPPALVDLALTVNRLRPSIAGTLGYHPDRVSRPAAAELLGQFRVLLRAGLAHPDLPISRLPVLTTHQRAAGFEPGRCADAVAQPPAAVHRLAAARAAQQPDVAAVDDPDGPLRDGDRQARVQALATGLRTVNEVEAAMAELWARLLGEPPADVEQCFFGAGGDSWQLLKLRALVRDRFGVEVGLAECYASPSLGGMAALVTAATVGTCPKPATAGTGNRPRTARTSRSRRSRCCVGRLRWRQLRAPWFGTGPWAAPPVSARRWRR